MSTWRLPTPTSRYRGSRVRAICSERGRLLSSTLPTMSPGLKAQPSRQHSRLTTVLLFGGAAVGIIALHLATNGTLGFHTDELYYLTCGLHPALGYVDFPPLLSLIH